MCRSHNVRFGSKADIGPRIKSVCFTPKSGHLASRQRAPHTSRRTSLVEALNCRRPWAFFVPISPTRARGCRSERAFRASMGLQVPLPMTLSTSGLRRGLELKCLLSTRPRPEAKYPVRRVF